MKDKRLIINIISQSIAFVVNLGISFLLTPFLVKNVGKEAYGFVGLANNFVSYAQVITVALNSMAGRYITISLYKKDNKSVNQYFTSVLIANIFIATLMVIPAVFVVLFMNKIVHIPTNILDDVRLLWTFIFLNFLIGIIGSIFGVATFAKNRLDLQSIRAIESNILKAMILLVAFYFLKPSVWYIGLALILCTIYITFANMYYTKKLLPDIKIKRKYFNFNFVKVLISSGIWNSLSSLSSILSTGLDLLIANIFVGASSMGVLSIAKTVPIMILSVFQMLASIFAPQLTISYAQNDFNGIKKQLLSSMKLLGMLSCIPMSILFAYGDVFYKLWVPTQNQYLLQLLSIISCFELIFALPLEGLWNVFTATNKVKQASIALLCESLISITITFIGITLVKNSTMKLFIIAGTSTVVGTIRTLTFLPMYGARCLKFKLTTFYPLLVKNAILVAALTLISIFIKKNIIINNWVNLIIACLATSIIGLFINIFFMLKKDGIQVAEKYFFKK